MISNSQGYTVATLIIEFVSTGNSWCENGKSFVSEIRNIKKYFKKNRKFDLKMEYFKTPLHILY